MLDVKSLIWHLRELWRYSDETARRHAVRIFEILGVPMEGDYNKPIFSISSKSFDNADFTISIHDFVEYARTQFSVILEDVAWLRDFYNNVVEERPDFKLKINNVVDEIRNATETIFLETTIDYSDGFPSSYWQELRDYVDGIMQINEDSFSKDVIASYSVSARMALLYFYNRINKTITLIENTAACVRC